MAVGGARRVTQEVVPSQVRIGEGRISPDNSRNIAWHSSLKKAKKWRKLVPIARRQLQFGLMGFFLFQNGGMSGSVSLIKRPRESCKGLDTARGQH
jgi:hypothetical protein